MEEKSPQEGRQSGNDDDHDLSFDHVLFCKQYIISDFVALLGIEERSQQEGRQPSTDDDHDISFDHVPKKKESEIAHVAVVRKRDERQKLKGHSCRECYQVSPIAGQFRNL